MPNAAQNPSMPIENTRNLKTILTKLSQVNKPQKMPECTQGLKLI